MAEIFATSRLIPRCVSSLVSLSFFPFGLFIRHVICFDPIFSHCVPIFIFVVCGSPFFSCDVLLRMILADRLEPGRSRTNLNDSVEKLVRYVCRQRSQIRWTWIYSLVTPWMNFFICIRSYCCANGFRLSNQVKMLR